MKILFFTDVHSGDHDDYVEEIEDMHKKFEALKEKSKECDLMVCCGDVSIFGGGLKASLQLLKAFNKKLLIIHGNHEMESELKSLCDNKNIIFLHKKVLTIDGVTFAGYGGGGFSEADERLDEWVKKIKQEFTQPSVLFTHGPPYNTTLDELPDWGHRGSKSIRKAIETLQPTLFAAGHFHEPFFARDTIGPTQLLNPGDTGVILEIKK